MNQRVRVAIALILLATLVGAVVYTIRGNNGAPVAPEPVPEEVVAEPLPDNSVRESRSYRLEDNLSVPSEKVFDSESTN